MKVIHAVSAVLLVAAGCRAADWEGEYYRFRLQKESPQWTIHGLWPEWAEGYCKKVKFNESKVQDLLPRLKVDWPSDQGNNTAFWAHEWEKHGSCTPFDEHTYFSTALNLYDKYHHECPINGGSNPTECNICFLKDLSKTCQCTANAAGQCPKMP